MTELRRRMFEELRLRNYSPNTIEVYLRCVANFAHHFRVSPDRLGPEHIREYQLFLVERKKVSWAVFNQTVCALRFFYHHTLHRVDAQSPNVRDAAFTRHPHSRTHPIAVRCVTKEA
jgi:integrase/recombinase XerD